MPDLENTIPEVAETTNPTPEAFAEDHLLPNTNDVAEAIQKARAQEKAKLYPQMEKLQEELAALKTKEQEREAKESERKAQRAARDAELAKQKKAEEEQSLELRDLLAKKEQEFQSQIEAERAEREKAFALLEREREFQELQQYRQTRIEAERDAIMPELIDMVGGNSKDEIEQSILSLKTKTAQIVDSVAAASQQTRKEMVGTRITVPASGPLDNDSEQRSYSPDDISNMSLADYAKNRQKLLGNTNTRGQGLFG
jgi:DNA repair exonuclease SbcCD ATPase subunit